MSGRVDAVPAVLGCESCGLVSANRLASADDHGSGIAAGAGGWVQRCPRCHSVLHAIRPFSVQRTWACTIAAAILYVPANLLPVMQTTNALERADHTLLGGIGELWADGSWALAIIVFVASIAVPVLKILGLALLAWTTQRASDWKRLERARLYRLIETVGHWSMLDVYVVVVIVASVRFGPIASVDIGEGMLAFAAVVVLTMLATYSFDPKLIWQDAPRPLDRTRLHPSASARGARR